MVGFFRHANPIAQRELRRQRATLSRRRRLLLLGFAVLAAVITYFVVMLRQPEFPVRNVSIYTVWVLNVAVAIRCIVAGVNVTAREFSAGTWDVLILTGVGARRIFWGQWRAALRLSAPWLLALGVMKLTMLIFSMLGIVNQFAYEMVMTYGAPTAYNRFPFPPDMIFFDWLGNYAVLAVVSAVALTMLDGLICTALGVLAAALLRSSTLAILLATALRLSLVIGGALVPLGDGTVDFSSLTDLFRHRGTAIADFGTAPISRLTAPYMVWSTRSHADAASTLEVVYVVALVMLLVTAISAYLVIYFSGAKPARRGLTRGFRNRVKWMQS